MMRLIAFVTACIFAAGAQAGTIAGVVRDSTGMVLPGVTVEARNGTATRLEVTAADGSYRIDVEPGRWDVTFRLINFASTKKTVQSGSDPITVDSTLHLSSTATVVVTAPATFHNPASFGEEIARYSDSASAGVVTASEIHSRPLQRPGDVLETVPGVIVSQHSGEGKANQYYLRGFNLDHGTDVAISVAGTPVNLPTHAHGHGYADTNFVIPELMSVVQYRKGPYAADAGDFASAGTVNISYLNALEEPVALIEAGGFGFVRSLVAGSPQVAGGHLLYALEWGENDGPWEQPDDHRRLNGVLRFSRGDQRGGFSITAMGYDARWNATDQIPARAVESGTLGRFGLIDESDGGLTSRYALTTEWQRTSGSHLTQVSAFGLNYRLSLFSNFTYFLDDPQNGDQFEQSEERNVFGLRATHRVTTGIFDRPVESMTGFQARRDDIDDIGLHHTRARARIGTRRLDDIGQTSGAAFAQASIQWHPKVRSVAGLRASHYRFDVRAALAANSGRRSASLVTPHLSLVAGPFRQTEVYANAGGGFHSNDARGTTMTIDPVSREPVSGVDPLVRTRGAELGLRTTPLPRLHLTAATWMLDMDSELLFVGDAGTTEATRPSRRRGVEVAVDYFLTQELAFDIEYAWSRARFADFDAAGDRIPGAVEGVASAAVSLNLPRASGEVRLRYVGARPLIEDASVSSEPSQLVSGRASWRINERVRVDLDAFNLLNADVSDIDYFYESRLPGEAHGVEDRHFHPVEPRSVRIGIRTTF